MVVLNKEESIEECEINERGELQDILNAGLTPCSHTTTTTRLYSCLFRDENIFRCNNSKIAFYAFSYTLFVAVD